MSRADDEPRVGHPLPRAEEAFIDPDKLARYSLDPGNPRGLVNTAWKMIAGRPALVSARVVKKHLQAPDHGSTPLGAWLSARVISTR
jgi:hypothetical protein